jgi:methionine biosynthesis protein MetW
VNSTLAQRPPAAGNGTASAMPPNGTRRRADIRVDLQLIADMVAPGARVLDIGCGDGALLDYLVHFKQVDGRGMELSQAGVNACVSHGLSVIQGDADTDLKDYPSNAFDYAILSQTLQATRDPKGVVEHLARIGRRAIVSFPNFGHWKVRMRLLLRGRMPVTEALPLHWYDTPNIHLCTIQDFVALCAEIGVTVERGIVISPSGRPSPIRSLHWANLTGEQALFLLKRG